MILLVLVALPTIVGVVTYGVRSARLDLGLLFVVAVGHSALVTSTWVTSDNSLAPFLALDATGRLFLTVTSGLFFVVSLYCIPYILGETHDEPTAPRRFVPSPLLSLAAMTLVCSTLHLALLWAAIEATTLASAPLVYFYRRRGALEATWKYLLICSVGIALALLGTFFLGIAASTPAAGTPPLTLRALVEVAPDMSRPWLKAAFVLALVGYGTKMGLAPMHTWLPDPHSQAPSPVSALLPGALLNCALLGILRFHEVCLAAGDAAFVRTLWLLLGFLSLIVSTAFLLGQSDYKRLFAYSSIENMGIIAVGIGLGGVATWGATLHAVNHSICKAGLFFLAGNVLREFRSTRAADATGVLTRLPRTGVLMMGLLLALGGLPPFGPFMSELTILRASLGGPHPWLGALLAVLLALAFLGMVGSLLPMLQGVPAKSDTPRPREAPLTLLSPAAMLVASLVLGVWLPPAVTRALGETARLLGGTAP